MKCDLCARHCKIDRTKNFGYCRCSNNIHIAHYGKFMFEEPCISGTNGSGAIFFSGCSLRCVYCQNYEISRSECGKILTNNQLIDIIKELESKNVHNINLVTPTHYSSEIYNTLKLYKPQIPVVYNTHSYENTQCIEKMSEVVDVFLADLKYYDSSLSQKYSNAKDYFEVATKAIRKMIELKPIIYEDDILKQGVIIRVLILPSHTNDTIKILEFIKENFANIPVSIMCQYTPCEDLSDYKEINRKITKREYSKVLDKIFELDLDGYCQELSSASKEFIPNWSLIK